MTDWIAALGLKPATVLAALLGAVVSLKFVPGNNLWQRGTNVVGGWLTATYAAPFAISFFSMNDRLEPGFAFLIGLYGMTAAAAFVQEIPRWLEAFREKYTR